MRAIFTSDWQADFDNIDLCREANKEILAYCDKYKVRTVAHCGDLKRAYNPIDGRMVNGVSAMLREYRDAGVQFVIDLGNHDRFGLHTDKENWLDILRNAGSLAYDEPRVVRTLGGADGGLLAFLPFRQSSVLMKREAYDLAKKVRNRKDKNEGVVLVFHSDLKLARYNTRTSSSAEMIVEDLYPDEYLVCIGGHIHLPQHVSKNVYYVGSPFATDWGEANQIKGYLMYDWETKKLTKLPSLIPRMLDPTWPGFEKAKPIVWGGAKVRIHVSCDSSTDIFATVQKAKLEAEKKYPGAEIVPVPELEQVTDTKIRLKAQDSDEQKVRTYVDQTLEPELFGNKEKIIQYMVAQLQKTGTVARRTGKLEFLESIAENFLSFVKLKIEYKTGLTVISGVNEDRRGKSNGSGKTSYLSPPAVAMFGATFKGQKHDHWMFRWTENKSKSYVGVKFKDQSGRICKVVRGRKPKFLRVWVEGKEIPAGNRPEQVQEAVEKLTGFTWETFAGAMFVDQRKTNLMLTGTESERKQFLSRLQGLDRFERALVEVKEDLAESQRKVNDSLSRVISAQSWENSKLESLEALKSESPDIEKVTSELAKKHKNVEQKKEKLQSLRASGSTKIKALRVHEDKFQSMSLKATSGLVKMNERSRSLASKIAKLKSISGECPTCQQTVDEENRDSIVETMQASLDEVDLARKVLEGQLEEIGKMQADVRGRINKIVDGQEELQNWIEEATRDVAVLSQQFKEAKMQEQRIKAAELSYGDAIVSRKKLQAGLEKVQRALPIYEYCVSAFSRKGMPAFLNAQLCPILNKAAAYYSQMFSEKEIQVVFNVNENGESDIRVVNAHGGSEVADQSQGEMRIASLITSFALRHVAPQTNLLILDEPGEGLDPLAARVFARGLKEIVPRFGSVFVVTHNPAILSELSSSRRLVIRKKNRVSRVEEENG